MAVVISNKCATAVVRDLSELEKLPTLRLCLNNNAKAIEASKPHQSTFVQNVKFKFTKIFEVAKKSTNLEQESSISTLRNNEAIIDAIFDDIQRQMDEERLMVKATLKELTPEQQNDVIAFWSAAADFLSNVLKWLQGMFQTIVEKIRQGFKIAKKVVEDIFNTIGQWLERIF